MRGQGQHGRHLAALSTFSAKISALGIVRQFFWCDSNWLLIYVGSGLTALYCIHTTKSQKFLFYCPHEINRNNLTFKYEMYLDSL